MGPSGMCSREEVFLGPSSEPCHGWVVCSLWALSKQSLATSWNGADYTWFPEPLGVGESNPRARGSHAHKGIDIIMEKTIYYSRKF